jgi:hypothetical protein
LPIATLLSRSVRGGTFFSGEKVTAQRKCYEFDGKCNAPDATNHAKISYLLVVFCAFVRTAHKLKVYDGLVQIHADDNDNEGDIESLVEGWDRY